MPENRGEHRSLVVFFGLTASGKSYLASRWAARRKCSYFNTDVIRKTLAGLAPGTRKTNGIGQGIYSTVHTRRTYDQMLSLVRAQMHRNQSVVAVLDGSYLDAQERHKLVDEFAEQLEVCFIYCFCPEDVTRQRLKIRRQDERAVSDGRWEVYLHQKEKFSLPQSIEKARLLCLNTAHDEAEILARLDVFVDSGKQAVEDCEGAPHPARSDKS